MLGHGVQRADALMRAFLKAALRTDSAVRIAKRIHLSTGKVGTMLFTTVLRLGASRCTAYGPYGELNCPSP